MSFLEELKTRLKVAKISGIFASSEIISQRTAICNSCEFLLLTRNCAKCGCFVDAKVRLQSSTCPMKKW